MTRRHTLAVLLGGVLIGIVPARATAADDKRERSPYLIRFHSASIGAAEAKVHIVEFLDPACEGCRAWHPVVKDIVAQNAGRVRLWVRHLPFHRGADFAVRILEASRRQGKYGDVLDRLFATQPQWAVHHVVQPRLVMQHLDGLGLDLGQLKRDMAAPDVEQLMQLDLADAKKLKVLQTPTFYVNGRLLGKYEFDELRRLVTSEIQAQYGERATPAVR